MFDSRALRSSPKIGDGAGYDGAERKKGSKLHMVMDLLRHLPALHVMQADADARAQFGKLAKAA